MSRITAPSDTELVGYFAGHLSAARTAEIDSWIASDPANASWAEAVRSLIASPALGSEWNRDRMWNALRAVTQPVAAPGLSTSGRTAREQKGLDTDGRRPRAVRSDDGAARRFNVGRRLLAVAASIIAVGAASRYMISRLSSRSGWAAHVGERSYATHRGERVTVQLLDGSKVTLAPESRLWIARGFGAHDRSVELEGEAEFSIVHDSTRPFTVRAGPALVVDIGTRFDLRAYASDRVTRVAVAEGAVAIGAASLGSPPRPSGGTADPGRGTEGVLVTGGEVGQLDGIGHATTTKIGNDAPYFGWTEGRLVFERRPLREVLDAIARWYDMDISVRDSVVADRLVTAEFSTESPSEMIQALANAVNASVVGSGRTFTLMAR